MTVRTVGILAHLHHARADAEEKDTLLLVLHVVLGHNDVQSRLGCSIQTTDVNPNLVGHVDVGQTCGNGDDLLDLALEDKRKEEVEEVDVTDDVGLEQVCDNTLELLRLVGPDEHLSLTPGHPEQQ